MTAQSQNSVIRQVADKCIERLIFPLIMQLQDRTVDFQVFQVGDGVKVLNPNEVNPSARQWHDQGPGLSSKHGGMLGTVMSIHSGFTPFCYSVLMEDGVECLFYSTQLRLHRHWYTEPRDLDCTQHILDRISSYGYCASIHAANDGSHYWCYVDSYHPEHGDWEQVSEPALGLDHAKRLVEDRVDLLMHIYGPYDSSRRSVKK